MSTLGKGATAETYFLSTLGLCLTSMVLSNVRVPSEYEECCLTRGKRFFISMLLSRLALLRLSVFLLE